MHAALAQNMRGHGGRRCLAVHAGDDDSTFARHDCGQRFRAADERFPSSTRAGEDRIVVPDRGRENHQLGIVRIARAVWRMETQPEPLQSVRFERAHFVGAAHVVPQFEEERGDPAHPASRDPDQVNPVALAREQCLQIDLRGERHDSVAYIFPSFPRRARLRFSVRAPRNSPTCAAVCPRPRSAREFSGRANRRRYLIPSE